MYISEFQVGNYKSFHTPPQLTFERGFNIIVGQNSAGKTALLEALSLHLQSEPHRSPITVPSVGILPDQTSWVNFSLSIGGDELLGLMLASGISEWSIPRPALHSELVRKIGYRDHTKNSVDRLVGEVMSQADFLFRLRLESGVGNTEILKCSSFPSFGLYTAEDAPPGRGRQFLVFKLQADRKAFHVGGATADESAEMGVRLTPQFRSRIYRFFAERFNMGECPFGQNPVLAQNAQNLPEVLNVLQANPRKFQEFNQIVSTILPHIKQVSVQPVSNKSIQVRVWHINPDTRRADLAIPLNKCGSGVGQVLAMLYVVFASDYPQVILIDEPQSFLHPGCVRKLIEVFRKYPQHQFIIATHSPIVITAASPEAITITSIQEGETTLQRIDPIENRDLELCLAELGARLSDVFGADRVLWVEGLTEELSFPLILERILQKPLMGTAILGIRRTGELEARDAARIFEIYRRLSSSTTLLPPTVGFLLDRECRADVEQTEMQRRSGDCLNFLPRRMYECYLLNPGALCAVMNGTEGFRPAPVTEDEVRAVIEAKRSDRRYFCHQGPDGTSPDWFSHIHAANVLKDMFNELSETRVSYDKIKHSVALTQWLVDHSPQELREVSELLDGLLS